MKTCVSCKLEKPLTEFVRSRRQKDGRHYSCKTCTRARNRAYYERNSAKVIAGTGAARDRNRLRILIHYSGGEQASCACCGELHVEFLTIDHVNGGGAQHRLVVGRGNKFYYWLIRNNFPDGFRILCMNCNLSLGRRGYCPHEIERQAVA